DVVRDVAGAERGDGRALAVPGVLARDVVDAAGGAHAVLGGAGRLVGAAARSASAPGHDELDVCRGVTVEGAAPDRRHAGAVAGRAAGAGAAVSLEQGAFRGQEVRADRGRLPAAHAGLAAGGEGEPRAGDQRDFARPEGAGQGAALPGAGAVAAEP